MLLLIDVGNTRIKWLLAGEENYNDADIHYGNLTELEAFIGTLDTSVVSALLAAVNQTDALNRVLNQAGFLEIYIAQSEAEAQGVTNSYQYPERMGVDRWLAMIAAYRLFTDSPSKRQSPFNGVLVVDAGSALTVDVIDGKGKHLGGYIVPGLRMAENALFSNTERVIQYKEDKSLTVSESRLNKLGNNTLQCVEYGLLNQMASFIQSIVLRYAGFRLVITGGDGQSLAALLSVENVIIDKNLVLKGLWQVRN